MKKILTYISALLAVLPGFLSACDDDNEELGAITVKEAKYANNRMELTLKDNEKLPLTIFTMPRTAEPLKVVFTPNHPEWMSVEDNVLIPAPITGGATVYEPASRTDTLTISAGGLSVRYVVIITNHCTRVKDINLTAAGANFKIKKGGATFNLAATMSFNPADAYDKTVTYKSSDNSIAEVSDEGIVKSLDKVGSAVITVSACDGGGATRTANVTVTE